MSAQLLTLNRISYYIILKNLVIIRRSYQKLDPSDPVIPQISVDLSDPTVHSSTLDADIMPEPYFNEPIINKNYAALPVHLQEIKNKIKITHPNIQAIQSFLYL